MHELAITESVVETITERLPGVAVARVVLEIGALSGVMPDAVRFCFDLVTAGTALDGAVLEIEEPAGVARCRECGAETTTDDPIVICPCGSVDVEVLAGRDLRIRAVEMKEQHV